jgi:hypothetical protein
MPRPRILASFTTAAVLALGLAACSSYEMAPAARTGEQSAFQTNAPRAQPPINQQWPRQPRMAPGELP